MLLLCSFPYMPFDDVIAHSRFYRAEVEIPAHASQIVKNTAKGVAIREAGQ